MRNQDRSLNEHDYPNLYYPELYLLEGGYKLFYESFKVVIYFFKFRTQAYLDHKLTFFPRYLELLPTSNVQANASRRTLRGSKTFSCQSQILGSL